MNSPVVEGSEPARTTSSWQSDRLDVGRYLRRVAYRGGRSPTVATLRALHRAHVAALAFENIDIMLGRAISLDIDSLQDKLVGRRRGGYCYEHNLLFAALLDRLDYSVTRLAGRVQPGKPGPRTHMLLLLVETEGSRWLADVGFGGGGLLEPIKLQQDTVERQGAWSYRLEHLDGEWHLQALRAQEWADLYSFTLEPQLPIDYAVYNHYTATHPASPFVRRLVVQRTEPGVRQTLHGSRLTTTRPDGDAEHHDLTADGVIAVLWDTFGIALDPEETALLSRTQVVPPSDDRLARGCELVQAPPSQCPSDHRIRRTTSPAASATSSCRTLSSRSMRK
jgi:N-hydroxyarylamine O-acetyltransferase